MYIPVKDREISLACRELHRNTTPQSLPFLLDYFPVCDTAENRQAISSLLIRDLCQHFDLPECKVIVYDKKAPAVRGRRKKGAEKQWVRGLYTRWTDHRTPVIEIWNLMNNGNQRTWLQNFSILLHEFIHHYDSYYLLINMGHDSGFESRLKHLTKMIRNIKRKRKSLVRKLKRG